MDVFDFETWPLWSLIVIFCIGAATVWSMGTRLADYADRIAYATGLGGALVGFVLLGAITSLPEIATSLTASLGGDASLAVNSMIGSDSIQLVMLAVADALVARKALTYMVPKPDVLAYSAMNILMMAIVAGAVASGDYELFGLGIGAGSMLLLLAYCGCLLIVRDMDRAAGWKPVSGKLVREIHKDHSAGDSVSRLLLFVAAAGVVILSAGFLITRVGETIAAATGIGSSFFGYLFLSMTTSLPDASIVIAAVRRNRPQLAIGDILGGNIFNLALIFMIDVAYPGGPVLGEVGRFSIIAASLAIILNCILTIGMVERRDRTIFRMGYDSFAILLLYIAGVAMLFQLRP